MGELVHGTHPGKADSAGTGKTECLGIEAQHTLTVAGHDSHRKAVVNQIHIRYLKVPLK
jgi:hypothetical protein